MASRRASRDIHPEYATTTMRDPVDRFATIVAMMQPPALGCGDGHGSGQVTRSHDARQGWRDNPEDDLTGPQHLPVPPARSDAW
jgi:hypothetical protein